MVLTDHRRRHRGGVPWLSFSYPACGQLGSVDLATVFAAARWQWVPLVLAGSAATYLGAALALTGYVRARLSFPRTVLAQLAASFAAAARASIRWPSRETSTQSLV